MTAQNTNDPPMTVAIAGNSAKTSHAKSGASGVSKTLNSAVCPADIRFAPSASVIKAIVNTSPNTARMGSSSG